MKNCPNCGEKMHGFMTSKFFIKEEARNFINAHTSRTSEAYCNECAAKSLSSLRKTIDVQTKELTENIQKHLTRIPIITANNPPYWHYEIVGIVSAQSVSGTGLFAELSTSVNDLFGTQSNTLGSKIKNGEEICKNKLKLECLRAGGNAVIATDIDYSEVGGSKAMLMVCMAGTAIYVKKWDDSFDKFQSEFDKLRNDTEKLTELTSINFPELTD